MLTGATIWSTKAVGAFLVDVWAADNCNAFAAGFSGASGQVLRR